MSSRNKATGTRWESAIVAYLQGRGWPHAERRALNGAQDRGDVAGVYGPAGRVVIEAKAVAALNLAGWLAEAQQEADNDGAAVGVVWLKRRMKASPADAYVLMDGATFTDLLARAGYRQEDRNDPSA